MKAHTIQELRQFQAMPLEVKVAMTKVRVRDWVNYYGEDGVYISFSGGKDSTVLLDIVRETYPNIPAVFVDTGLEYPEIRNFVKTFDNVTWLKPKKNFKQVIENYGYPLISKEVSECVEGAKRYLLNLKNGGVITNTSMKSYADKASICQASRGGEDNRYRKLRGIGEYSKREKGTKKRRTESEISTTVGVADRGRDDKGEYP